MNNSPHLKCCLNLRSSYDPKLKGVERGNLVSLVRFLPAAGNLCDCAAHKLEDLAGQHFVERGGVAELAVHAGAEGEDAAVARQRRRVVAAAGDEGDAQRPEAAQLRRTRPIGRVTDAELAERVFAPAVHNTCIPIKLSWFLRKDSFFLGGGGGFYVISPLPSKNPARIFNLGSGYKY